MSVVDGAVDELSEGSRYWTMLVGIPRPRLHWTVLNNGETVLRSSSTKRWCRGKTTGVGAAPSLTGRCDPNVQVAWDSLSDQGKKWICLAMTGERVLLEQQGPSTMERVL